MRYRIGTPTAIAQHLGVSVKTVSTHRSRALGKMGLKSTAELIHYALQHRLVLPLPEERPQDPSPGQ